MVHWQQHNLQERLAILNAVNREKHLVVRVVIGGSSA